MNAQILRLVVVAAIAVPGCTNEEEVKVTGITIRPEGWISNMIASGQDMETALAAATSGGVKVSLEDEPENYVYSDDFGVFELSVPANSEFKVATWGDDYGSFTPTRTDKLWKAGDEDVDGLIEFTCTAKLDSAMNMIAESSGLELQEMLDRGYCMIWTNNAPFPEGFEVIQFMSARILTPGWNAWAANTSEDGMGLDRRQTYATPADETGWATSRFGFWAAVRDTDLPPVTEPELIEWEFDSGDFGIPFPHGFCSAYPGISTFQLPPVRPLAD